MTRNNKVETPGLDTIMGLVGSPPMEIELNYDTVRLAEALRQLWNRSHIAFIPYCMKCKKPLVWVSGCKCITMFKCPECGRKWIKSKQWKEQETK